LKQVFRFNDEVEFDSASSAEFAELLLSIPGDVRTQLTKTFGLGIRFDRNPILTRYDGRKVGFGSFSSSGDREVHFVIAPKTNSLRLQNLFQALGKYVNLNHIRFDSIVSSAPTEQAKDDFTFAFLLKLLEEIVISSTHLLNAAYKRKEIAVQGGVKGRPLLVKSMKNMVLGRNTGIICEVLDDEGLQDYAAVLLATARSIGELLEDWHEITAQKQHDSLAKLRYITSRFSNQTNVPFNRSLLYKVCRPPFPYGLKDVLYKCMRYWQWQGAMKISNAGNASYGYWSVVMELDLIFQDYVGFSWHTSLEPQFKWHPNKEFKYLLRRPDGVNTEQKIKPDHLFIDQGSNLMLIVDAKYSEKIAAEDQIYQIAAYLSYCYEESLNCNDKIGILVYPGDTWQVEPVLGFRERIYCVRLPIQPHLKQVEIAKFLATATERSTTD